MVALSIPKEILETMLSHCRSIYPCEACGILAGRDGTVKRVYAMTNVEKSPVSYFMDSMEQFDAMKSMRAEGNEMIAIYHSHPDSPAYPSQKDINLAFYQETAYIIISLLDPDSPVVRAFNISECVVSELSFFEIK